LGHVFKRNTMTNIPSDLAHFKYLTEWSPQIGDIVIWHGWFTHWYGVVSSITNSTVGIIKSGLPILLLTMDQSDYDGNTMNVSISDIRRSTGGKYATIRSVGSNTVWYI
jgi:hypothetical protein